MTEEIKPDVDESVPIEPLPVVVVQEASVGTVLREAREAAGLRLEDIAERFKLRVAQVQAVEADEWAKLPGRTFARGLVRGYARELRLDAEALASRVLPEIKAAETPIVPPSTQNLQPTQAASENPRKDLGMVVVGVVILAVAILAYFLWPVGEKAVQGPVLPPPSTEAPVPSAVVQPVGDNAPQPLTPNIVPLNVPSNVPAGPVPQGLASAPSVSTALIKLNFSGSSWVEIKDKNGSVVFSQTGVAGSEKEINGQAPFSFHIGNAAVVKVQYKGQPVDLQPFTINNVSRLKLD